MSFPVYLKFVLFTSFCQLSYFLRTTLVTADLLGFSGGLTDSDRQGKLVNCTSIFDTGTCATDFECI